MDQAYPTEKLVGPRSRPQLSAMLNRPLSFPRIFDETRVVDAIVSTRVSFLVDLVGLATGEGEGGRGGYIFFLRHQLEHYPRCKYHSKVGFCGANKRSEYVVPVQHLTAYIA